MIASGVRGWLLSVVALAAGRDDLRVAPDALHETEHFAVHVDGTPAEAQDLGAVLEAALPRFEAVLGVELPRGGESRAEVLLLADRDAWLARIRRDGIEPPGLADYVFYSPDEDTIYLYRLATWCQTRALALHGGFQRFHCRARPKNRDLVRTWFVMGLADHLALHQWDGETLRLGAQPVVGMNDPLAQALFELDPERFDPSRLFAEGLDDGRVCFALVRYLLEFDGGRYRARFEKLALGHSGSKLSPNTYAARLGAPVQHARDLYGWLADHQQPMQPVHGVWEDRGGGTVVGEPFEAGYGFALFKQPVAALAVSVRRGGPEAYGGIVFGHAGPKDFWVAGVQAGEISVRQYELGLEKLRLSEPLEGSGASATRLRVLVSPGAARLFVDGEPLADWEVEGEGAGLFAAGARIEFGALEWR